MVVNQKENPIRLQSVPKIPEVHYNPEFFTAEEVEKLLALKAAEEVEELIPFPLESLTPTNQGTITEEDAESVLQKAMEVMRTHPELREMAVEAGGDLVSETKGHFLDCMVYGDFNERNAARNQEVRDSIQMSEEDGYVILRVDGHELLKAQVGSNAAGSLTIIWDIAGVVLDIVFIIAAAVNIAVIRGEDWAKKVADFFKEFSSGLLEWAKKWIAEPIKEIFSELQAAVGNTPRVIQVLNGHATFFAKWLAQALKYLWDHKLIQLIWKTIKLVFAGSWIRLAAAVLCFIGGVIAAIASFGESLVLAILNMAAQFIFLIGDLIKLVADLLPEKDLSPIPV